ncbi:Uncharacterised protein [[Clostridium] sordellii]|uniref:hypothetical protein n=1 Tax=Paraclostridium sordellii TaxID=1505 RepID=UPI0005E5945E|nr:hypothetical protein [Paeniclostridium sordellii]CEQ26509.1 Uncharacterised protein [[Clostridium] sordellii] [Paeniclostridium sordellii]
MKDTNINIRINAELKKHLETLSQINNMNMSETIRAILKENLEAENNTNLKLISLERKADKVRDILSKSKVVYLLGENSEVEIKFNEFDVEAFSMPSSNGFESEIVLSISLFENLENNKQVASIFLNDDCKIDVRKDYNGENLVISKL